VKRTYLPLHSVIRIDEVRKSGVSKVSAVDSASNVASFPSPCTPARRPRQPRKVEQRRGLTPSRAGP